jgi:hypothetical protein
MSLFGLLGMLAVGGLAAAIVCCLLPRDTWGRL